MEDTPTTSSTATTAMTCPVCRTAYTDGVHFALHVASCTSPSPRAASAQEEHEQLAVTRTPTAASCALCHMVYTSALAPHEIAFHEEECARMNEELEPFVEPEGINGDTPMDGSGGSGGGGGSSSVSAGGKRSRDGARIGGSSSVASASSSTTTLLTPAIKIFPAHCAVCEHGGRTLLHCAGKCGRSFHAACVDELNAPLATGSTAAMASSSSSSSIGPSSAWAKGWVCGNCTRGVHACQLCGFLGHETHELVACAVPDCGFWFHHACLRASGCTGPALLPDHPRTATTATARPGYAPTMVCPRHRCATCHAIETSMATCRSCTRCCAGTMHLRCAPASSVNSLDPHFYICAAHQKVDGSTTAASTVTTATVATSSTTGLPDKEKEKQQQRMRHVGLRLRLQTGELVLVLEYGNALLPASAKDSAPDACNQWGIVTGVEALSSSSSAMAASTSSSSSSSSSSWNQLLQVQLFSEGTTISVLNRYVLPVGRVHDHASPAAMLRWCIQHHSISEVHLRHSPVGRTPRASVDMFTNQMQRVNAMVSSYRAFRTRALAAMLTTTQCTTEAGRGYAQWEAFFRAENEAYKRVFVPERGAEVPIYLMMDTRGPVVPEEETKKKEEGKRSSGAARPRGSSGGADGGEDGDDGDVDMDGDTRGGGGEGRGGGRGGGLMTAAPSQRTAAEMTTRVGSTESVDAAVTMAKAVRVESSDAPTAVASAENVAPEVAGEEAIPGSEDGVELRVDGVKAVGTVEAVKAVETMEPVEAVKAVDAVDALDAVKAVKAVGAVEAEVLASVPAFVVDAAKVVAPSVGLVMDVDMENDANRVNTVHPATPVDQIRSLSASIPAVSATQIERLVSGVMEPLSKRVKRVTEAPTSPLASVSASPLASASAPAPSPMTTPTPTPALPPPQPSVQATPITFTLSSTPLQPPRSKTFNHTPEVAVPVSKPVTPTKNVTKKQAMALGLPRVLMNDLESHVDAYFATLTSTARHSIPSTSCLEAEQGEGKSENESKNSSTSVVATWPRWRPAFFRPSPMLSRSYAQGRRVDAVSRVLLCQDKRNLKCFVVRGDGLATATTASLACAHAPRGRGKKSADGYVMVDLLAVSGFAALAGLVRSRVHTALAMDELDVNGEDVPVLSTKSTMKLLYCAFDGSQHALELPSGGRKKQQQQQQQWLCFCANVCHLSVVVGSTL